MTPNVKKSNFYLIKAYPYEDLVCADNMDQAVKKFISYNNKKSERKIAEEDITHIGKEKYFIIS